MKKFILLLILLVLSPLTFARVKHIVFNIEGTLIQGIPQRNYQAFKNKDQMISVSDTRSLYYYIYPKASYLINHLQSKDQILVHYMTTRSKKWADQVLKAINLPEPIRDSLYAYLGENSANLLFTSEDLTNGKLDLRKISTDLANVIVVTTDPEVVPESQRKNILNIGESKYYFEDFATASREREAAPASAKASFPATEKELFIEQNKSSFIYQILSDVRAATSSNLVSDLGKLKIDKEDFTVRGQLVSRFNFKEKALMFKYNDAKSRVVGCGMFSTSKNEFEEDRPLDQCLSAFSTKAQFRVNRGANKVEACELLDEATGALIRDEQSLTRCLNENKESVNYYWVGKDRTKCGAYVNTVYIQTAKAEECGNGHVVKDGKEFKVIYLFLVNGKLVEAIPGITEIGPGGLVDKSVYYDFNSQLIGLSLVTRARIQKGELEDRPGDYDFLNDTRIAMAFNFKYLSSIQKSGFLNQHQTGTSNGYLGQTTRADIENRLMNIRLESSYGAYGKVVNEVRPKYSYLLLDKYRPDMTLNKLYAHYGNVMAIFSSKLKARATFTNGDSLNIQATSSDVRTFWFRSPRKISITNSSGYYWESQIWGSLSVDDVDYFLVNCFEPLTSTQILELKQTGRPVYECKTSQGETHAYNVTKGREL